MIRTKEALGAILDQGRTIVRMSDFAAPSHFRWVLGDTNEPVHGQAIKLLIKKGRIAVIAEDLCGHPSAMGAAVADTSGEIVTDPGRTK